uniref:Uncharacterized protein n=1 Tax=Avena sativa TaxID=4498 RepID=A0ACD5ZYU8_AVESA
MDPPAASPASMHPPPPPAAADIAAASAGPSLAPEASSSAAAAAAEDLAGAVAVMTLDERYELLMSIGEECIQPDELRKLLQNKPVPICYDGFEPSGRMHIAQGIVKTINVNKMIRAGCKVKIWIADWFAQLNNKMGGDLKKIQTVGRYMIEIWKAAGMNLDGVEFLWSSEEINRRANEYWPLVMDIGRKNNVKRITRCCTIMGRADNEELTAAQIFYPCMQCADIFFLKADICQLGMDQRKVNMLAREYCDDIKKKLKPIILSHHMLPGFKEGQEKMSKSDPSSAIFMEDDEVLIIFFLFVNNLYLSSKLPVRDHFNTSSEAKVLLNTVKEFNPDICSFAEVQSKQLRSKTFLITQTDPRSIHIFLGKISMAQFFGILILALEMQVGSLK